MEQQPLRGLLIADVLIEGKQHGATDYFVTVGEPLHNNVTGDSAYVVVPATMSFKVGGKQITQTGAVFTVALRKLADGYGALRLGPGQKALLGSDLASGVAPLLLRPGRGMKMFSCVRLETGGAAALPAMTERRVSLSVLHLTSGNDYDILRHISTGYTGGIYVCPQENVDHVEGRGAHGLDRAISRR